jgi:hypothetical protein
LEVEAAEVDVDRPTSLALQLGCCRVLVLVVVAVVPTPVVRGSACVLIVV